jgi:hypothetical protein
MRKQTAAVIDKSKEAGSCYYEVYRINFIV